jgi:hypothetical protein
LSKFLKTPSEVIKHLDKFASINGNSPTAEITHAALLAWRANATQNDLRSYEALCDHFKGKLVQAPNGQKYKIVSLQREYLRYVLVERFRLGGAKWAVAYEQAAKYVGIEKGTAADSHGKMKNVVLKHPEMKAFCTGLEFEFQIALYNGVPPLGSYIEPDFLVNLTMHSEKKLKNSD